MIRKHVQARRERNRELGQRDMANRCTFCKRALPTVWTCRLVDGARFCNSDCEADDAERTALMEARR